MIDLTKAQAKWLYSFAKAHNLKDGSEVIQKLIDCYKAWGEINEAKKN
jgi:hypothetical protein